MIRRLLSRPPASLSVRAKIIAAFAVLLLVVVGLGATSISRFNALRADIQQISVVALNKRDTLDDVRNAINVYELLLLRTLTDPDDQPQHAVLKAAMARNASLLDTAFKSVSARGEEAGLLQSFHAAWEDFSDQADHVWTVTEQAGDPLAARSAYLVSLKPSLPPLQDALRALLHYERVQVEALQAAGEAGYRRGLAIVFAMVAAAVASAVGAAALLIRGIAFPVRAMTACMRALAAHDLDVRIPARGRGDEIGQMADAVHVFHDAMVTSEASRTAERAAVAQRTERAGRLDDLVRNFEQHVARLAAALTESAGSLSATAGGMDGTATASRKPGERSCPRGCRSRTQRAGSSFGRIAIDRLHTGNQPPGGAFGAGQPRRCRGSRADGQRHGTIDRRSPAHRRCGGADRLHRGADQFARVECHDRGGARGRGRPGLRSGGVGGKVPRWTDAPCDRRYRHADRADAECGAGRGSRRLAALRSESTKSAMSPARLPPL